MDRKSTERLHTGTSGPETRGPGHSRPLVRAAERICLQCRDRLPDLSEVVVLLPQWRPAPLLREALFERAEETGGCAALLLPRIVELRRYAADLAPPDPERHLIGPHERLLMLSRELQRHRTLYGRGSPGLLAENLLQLFDELTLFRVELPDSPEALAGALAAAYRLPADNAALQREARLVHTLWRAWHEQLAAEKRVDTGEHYLRQLSLSLEALPAGAPLFALGFDDCLPAERRWLEQAATRAGLVVLDGEPPPSDPARSGLFPGRHPDAACAAFFDAAYDGSGDCLFDRIDAVRRRIPQSPIEGRLHVLGVNQLEQQAQAVALFVRAAMADGARRVGIVTEDRRLARRTRALLERSDIALHDTVGWALSTTSAAAAVENWLECVEGDFPHLPLLDLLKSPFVTDPDDAEKLNLVYRFGHDIVLHENTGSGLKRYRHAVESRARRLKWGREIRLALLDLLDHLERAAAPLSERLGGENGDADRLEALHKSLHLLGITPALIRDEAGERLLDELEALHAAARRQPGRMRWTEFRAWLSRALEQTYFQPPAPQRHAVQLLNLQQSQLQHFDALAIAAADETHLPGEVARLPFFNDAVRAALGLPDWRHRLRTRERRFRALLESSPSILVTWQQERDGEPVAASPWIAALNTLHEQVYGHDLEPPALRQWLEQSGLVPVDTDEAVPVTVPRQPAPAIPADVLPGRLSVSAHQRLVDCPYRFYVYDVLQLKALDEVREALQKSDYGSRVHRCLEAFHVGVNNLPGPFGAPLTAENRPEALALMENIARRVFARDTENNFQDRGWLRRWLDFAPDYIDWQIARESEWRVAGGERKTETALDAGLTLRGRIDRIDQRESETALIDYKTGAVPRPAEVESGEDVQLASYALLLEHVDAVVYLGLDGRDGVNDRTRLDGEALSTLRTAVRERLVDLMARIRNGAPLPANGDEPTCRHCDAVGVCRRQAWKPF